MKKSLNRSDFFVYMLKKLYLCTRKDESNIKYSSIGKQACRPNLFKTYKSSICYLFANIP